MGAAASSTDNAPGNVVPIGGACQRLRREELEALHLLQLGEPEHWPALLLASTDPVLRRAAQSFRRDPDALAPGHIERALARTARLENQAALAPAWRWLVERNRVPDSRVCTLDPRPRRTG